MAGSDESTRPFSGAGAVQVTAARRHQCIARWVVARTLVTDQSPEHRGEGRDSIKVHDSASPTPDLRNLYAIYSVTRAGAAQATSSDEATYSLAVAGKTWVTARAGAAYLPVRRLLAAAGAIATWSTSTIPSIACGTGASSACSMMRSELRSCGMATWTICSLSVCVSASGRLGRWGGGGFCRLPSSGAVRFGA